MLYGLRRLRGVPAVLRLLAIWTGLLFSIPFFFCIMAIPSWLTLSQLSGNGDENINVTGTEHTGRVVRTYTLTVTATGPTACKVTTNQSPAAEFCTFTSSTASIGKEGGALTITGKSNSTKLTFAVTEGGSLTLTLPSNYKASGVATANGAVITGDPGATAAFSFSIEFTVAPNTTIEPKTATVTVTDAGGTSAGAGQYHSCVVTQNAGDAYLYVNAEGTTTATITIPAAGGSSNQAQFSVISNTDWVIS